MEDQPPSAAAQQKLFESAALIIRLAEDKGVDPYDWMLGEDGNGGTQSTELSLGEFTSRLTSLAFAVTVHCGGRKTMLEVERGLSEKALLVIAKMCGERDSTINVAAFLTKCSELAHPRCGLGGGGSSSRSSSSCSPAKSSTTLLPASPYDEEILFASVEADDEEEEEVETPRAQTQRKSLPARIRTPMVFPLKEKEKVKEKEKEKEREASTAYHLRDPVDLVEDVLRNLTRQPNDYLRLQLHLGWHTPSLRDSTARGFLAIAALGKKEGAQAWLTGAVVKMALLEGRAPLSEAQIDTLLSLVQGFAATQRKAPNLSAFASSLPAGPMSAKKQSLQTQRAKKVVFKGRLNAQWLRLYLEHLRLHNRTSSLLSEKAAASAAATAATAPTSAATADNADADVKIDAFAFSFAEEEAQMPKELQRALQGRPHSLSAEELRVLLQHHPLLSEAQLQAEVGHRVRCWTSDLSGHDDYERKVRVALSQLCKTPESQPASHLRQLEAAARDRLSREKAEGLLSSERLNSAITRSLFAKFDSFCRASNYSDACSWKDWIEWYQSADEVSQRELDVRRIQRVASLRLAESAEKVQSQPLSSPFYWHESSFLTEATSPPRDKIRSTSGSNDKATSSSTRYFRSFQPASAAPSNNVGLALPPRSPSLGTRHGTQLRNNLALARCNLMTAGVGLDATIGGLDDLLAPLEMGLPPDSPRPQQTKNGSSSNSSSSSSDKNKDNNRAINFGQSSVFSFAAAVGDDEAAAAKEQARHFKRWKARKAQQLRDKKQKEVHRVRCNFCHLFFFPCFTSLTSNLLFPPLYPPPSWTRRRRRNFLNTKRLTKRGGTSRTGAACVMRGDTKATTPCPTPTTRIAR